jgi:hypothetical protein
MRGTVISCNHLEVNEELENITPEYRAHPAVLEVRWKIYATANEWEYAAKIARAISKPNPDSPLDCNRPPEVDVPEGGWRPLPPVCGIPAASQELKSGEWPIAQRNR